MKGIRFLVDENGEAEAVLIDLKKHRALWEDLQDILVTQDRKKEPRLSLAQVVSRLKKAGKLK
jgi:hypothetical protein